MKRPLGALLFAASFLICGPGLGQTTLTIATVNNGDMIRMQGLTGVFTAKNPDINVKWVTLEENVLRQRVTTDIATKGGQFDILTIGTYEVPIWRNSIGWCRSIISAPPTTPVIFCRRSAMQSASTVSCMPRRSTAKAP